ncbi:MAG: hypothetical protein Q4E56_01135 [Pseudomonadota bacterium]|nr:hypothetical protein [Pseudomonadota bacterium]
MSKNGVRTSAKVAKIAGKILQDGRSSAAAKRVAANAVCNRRKK